MEVVAVVVAGALQLVVGWLTAVSGLVAPLWAVFVLGVVSVAASLVLVRTVRRRPLAAPLVPVGNGLLWVGAVAAGGAWLGWTA